MAAITTLNIMPCAHNEFLDAFAKLRKRRLASSCLSVRPSVRTEQLGLHQTGCHEILCLNTFRNCSEKIQILSKSDKNNGYFTCRLIYIFHHLPLRPFRMRNDKAVEKIIRQISCTITFFFSKIFPFMS